MELSVEQLVEIIIKAYEKGQKTAVSRLATEVHDLRREFVVFKDELFELIDKRIKGELSNISAPHEAVEEGAETSPPPDYINDQVLEDIIIDRIFGHSKGRRPKVGARVLIYLYLRGGTAPLSDVKRRFKGIESVISKNAVGSMIVIEGQGRYKILRLKDSVKKELDQILSQYRRS